LLIWLIQIPNRKGHAPLVSLFEQYTGWKIGVAGLIRKLLDYLHSKSFSKVWFCTWIQVSIYCFLIMNQLIKFHGTSDYCVIVPVLLCIGIWSLILKRVWSPILTVLRTDLFHLSLEPPSSGSSWSNLQPACQGTGLRQDHKSSWISSKIRRKNGSREDCNSSD
jgi:hypothetical protein